MNCQEFWNQAPPSCAPGGEFAVHLTNCPTCAAAWDAQRNVAAGLRRMAEDERRAEAPARVEARLRNAFRLQAGLAYNPRHRTWLPVFAWAAATAAVLVLAVSLLRVHTPQTAAPKPLPNTAILAAVEGSSDAAGDSGTAALDGGFIPLPNVEQLGPNEPADVVRLEVPRSAMIAVGFEVNPERAAEPVQAEVMFGPDGVARAVRFLDETF